MSQNLKSINGRCMWCYYSPDGYIQVRSIADTKALSREMICRHEAFTWQDYEAKGFILKRVRVKIEIQ